MPSPLPRIGVTSLGLSCIVSLPFRLLLGFVTLVGDHLHVSIRSVGEGPGLTAAVCYSCCGLVSAPQIGSSFRLLPMRHEPVEPPYPSPYHFLPEPVDDNDLCCLQVCSDGSSRNRPGALAVAILPPYGDVAKCVVCAGRVLDDCTNIRAEVLAAVRAMKLILALRRYLDPYLPIRYMTDSSFVLQVLSEAIRPTIYARDINELH